jgi:hypothetical protein
MREEEDEDAIFNPLDAIEEIVDEGCAIDSGSNQQKQIRRQNNATTPAHQRLL